MKSQIKYGAIISYLSVFLNILIGLVYTPWMIRTIGKADYGLYTLACSVIGIFVFDFGLGQAVTRFAAKYIAENKQEKVDQLMGITYKLYIFADIIVLGVLSCLFFFLSDIYTGLTPEELDKFRIVYAIAASFSVLSFPFIPLNGVLSAYELFVQLKGCDIVHKLIIVILMAFCLLLGYGLYALVIVNAIAGIAVILLKLYYLKKKTTLQINWRFWDKALLKEIIGFSIWVTVAALAQRLVLNICPSILGMVSDSQNIALFGIAMTLEAYVYTIANAMNGLFLPKVTQYVVSGRSQEILPLMIKIGRLQFFVLGLIILGFVCVGENFINVWLGHDFIPVYLCALLMIAPSFIGLAQQIASTAVVVLNMVKQSAFISIVQAAINIVLAYPLARLWGAYGICISVFFAYGVSVFLNNLLYHKGLKIDIPEFFKRSLLKMAIPMALCLISGYLLNFLLGYDGLGNMIIKGFFFTIVYVAVFYKFVFDKNEWNQIVSPFLNIINKYRHGSNTD